MAKDNGDGKQEGVAFEPPKDIKSVVFNFGEMTSRDMVTFQKGDIEAQMKCFTKIVTYCAFGDPADIATWELNMDREYHPLLRHFEASLDEHRKQQKNS